VPSIPPDVDELVMAALEKDPEKRIPGCQEFLRLLAQVGTETKSGEGGSLRFVWGIGLLLIISLILIWIATS
jgi:hypothetical protein